MKARRARKPMKCPLCKAGCRTFNGPIDVDGVEVVVQGIRCTKCNELIFDAAQVGQMERRRADAIVQRGIRTGVEFKFVRKVAELTAVELAGLLDVNAKTISRWETGDVELPRIAAFILGEPFEHPRAVEEKLQRHAS